MKWEEMTQEECESGMDAALRKERASSCTVDSLVRHPGDRVVIEGPHPWKGHSGTLERWMDTPVGKMWRVKLDNGMSAGCRNELLRDV